VKGTKALVLEGTPLERGQQHGEELRKLIHEGVCRWKDYLHKVTDMDPDQYIKRFIKKTHFVKATKESTPWFVQEVRGIGEGADLDFDTIFAWQLLDEGWWYESERKIRAVSGGGEECSAIGVFGGSNSASVLGQNMDLPCFLDGLQVLLHIKEPESSSEALVFSLAGLIALNGVNNHGIGVCVNTLSQLNHADDGLPVAFIIRSILRKPSIEGAVRFICAIKHASGENYMIGDCAKIVDLECSANSVVSCEAFDIGHGQRCVIHTNHPLVNNDEISYHRQVSRLPPDLRHSATNTLENSKARLEAISSAIMTGKEANLEDVKSILRLHKGPVCVHKGEEEGKPFTFGSTIMVLSDSPELYLTYGPPCSKIYNRFTF